MTGCSKYSDSLGNNDKSKAESGTSGFYSNLTAGGDTNDYSLSGKAFVSEVLPCLYITSSENSEISIKGELKGLSGNVEIVYIGDGSEQIIVSTKDKNTDIDTTLQLESGNGRIEFRGNNVNFRFDLSIVNIDRTKIDYLGAESRNEEKLIDNDLSDTEILPDVNSDTENQDELLQETTATYTNDDTDRVVLNTEIIDDTKINILLRASVSNTDDNKSVSFNGFELVYKTEGGKYIEVVKLDEKATAFGGYEWQDSFVQEIDLPKGTNQLIYNSKKGTNYKIELDIQVLEAD